MKINYSRSVAYSGLVLFLFFSFWGAQAQSPRYDSRHKAIRFIQTIDVLDSLDIGIHTGMKTYARKQVSELINENHNRYQEYSNLEYLKADNRLYIDSSLQVENKKSLLKYFYNDSYNLLKVEKPAFKLYINPILNIQFGKESDSVYPVRFRNTRGIELYGTIDDKIYFYSNLEESQGNFHNYILDRINLHRAIPGYSFYKPFKSGVVDDLRGFDYANAQGYLGVPISKHVAIELGHGKHFIGHGHHSLLLEDYSNNYFYLKLNTNLWKFNYQNLWAELSPISNRLNVGDQLLPKKYMAAHYLSFRPNKVFEIGLYEAVIFSRLNQFEFHYLNPVILYRSVEYYLDSPDNVILGLNGKLNLFNHVSLYGQFALDDIKFGELFNGSGWWGNKFGIQAGVFYPKSFGVENLNIRVEANLVRPYTYSHRDTVPGFDDYAVANYSTYNQPLAHPLGANFGEILGIIDYQVTDKLFLSTKLSYAIQGISDDDHFVGDNILIPDERRIDDFGINFLEGDNNTIQSLLFEASYSFFHNYYLDLNVLVRSEDFKGIDTNYFSLGVRANMSNYHLDY